MASYSVLGEKRAGVCPHCSPSKWDMGTQKSQPEE